VSDLTVIIPTYRRPALLKTALRSCIAQTGFRPGAFEVVVVDNCPARSAAETVAQLGATAGVRIRYVAEATPGISSARNAGLEAADTDLVAFLDDDDDAAPNWVAAMMRTQRERDADAVFGPVQARVMVRPRLHPDFFEDYFSRRLAVPEGTDITTRYSRLGTGNSLFRRSTCFPDRAQPFAPRLGLVGGEDSLLLKQLFADGRRFYWSQEALVFEHVGPERLSVGYVCKRRFRSGQIRSETCLMLARPRPLETLLWMAVGLAQCLGWGVVAALLGVSRSRLALRALTSASGGLGKILWMRAFQMTLYGSTGPAEGRPEGAEGA